LEEAENKKFETDRKFEELMKWKNSRSKMNSEYES